MKPKHYGVVSGKTLIGFIVNGKTLEYAIEIAKKWNPNKRIKLIEVKLAKKVNEIFNTCHFGVNDWELAPISKIKLFDAGIKKGKDKKKPSKKPVALAKTNSGSSFYGSYDLKGWW